MGKVMQVNSDFWLDDYTAKLGGNERLLFLYLLTNPSSNIAGIYQLPIQYMAIGACIDEAECIDILKRFAEDKRIYYTNGWVIIANRRKYNNIDNPKIKKGVESIISKVPLNIKEFLNKIDGEYPMHSLCVGYAKSDININKNKNKNKDINKNKDVYMEIVQKWNNNGFRPIRGLNDDRRRHLAKRLKEPEFDIDKIIEKTNIAKKNPFVSDNKWFSFDFVIKNGNNYLKLLEGNYDPPQKKDAVSDDDVIPPPE